MKMLNGVWMTLCSLDASPAFLFIFLPEEISHGPSRDKCTNFVESLGLRICHILCMRSWARRLSSVNFSLLSEVWTFSSVQFSSVIQSCPTLCDRMNYSKPGLPVHHQLSEFTQTHAHWVGDAIQPSHPLSSPSPPTPNPSQHQGLFQWVNSLHEVANYSYTYYRVAVGQNATMYQYN